MLSKDKMVVLIVIEKYQHSYLKKLSRKRKMSMSRIIRELITKFLIK